ncbi:hypothetical protein IEQ34_004764 [Dendrobium chrysotoxum]|uniref:Terpene synthase N-terminal domain-containing protein n=1 Tax=Dendrobium chrysotoxum TaxID=161865 RepID=A0AAV7HG41_DENCH|nr:hypothetical protein IEQ34_004764 [Dendrobium chrysotoxum]
MASSAVGKASPSPAIPRNSLPPAPGNGGMGGWRRKAHLAIPAWRGNAILKSSFHEYRPKFSDKKLKEVELPKKIPEQQEESAAKPAGGRRGIWEMIKEVKAMLSSMGDGEITSSAYDTAWVAMVPGAGGCGPRFPSSLQWIVDNQLDDGSWGDQGLFSAHDRIISTLACVVALRFWNLYHDQCQKGLLFLKENMRMLAEEDEELMPIGFEVALPSLMDLAKGLGLDCPFDDPALQFICSKREIKLKRIPRELMHKVPTTLLHSLEGMPGLEWQSLLKLQSSDGSFLFSPSSTAYALMQTGDENCLRYLKKVVDRFHGGVPNVYPVDLFEHIWVVDRLQRLGISRYFQAEIKQCMDYIFKHWSEHGICWARSSEVRDIDDTAMAFRLLRLHGYSVSPVTRLPCRSGTNIPAVFFGYTLQRILFFPFFFLVFLFGSVMLVPEKPMAESGLNSIRDDDRSRLLPSDRPTRSRRLDPIAQSDPARPAYADAAVHDPPALTPDSYNLLPRPGLQLPSPASLQQSHADVFQNFKRDDKFFGFIGQSTQAVTGMYNLNRASQLIFPDEEILKQAKNFSYHYLREKHASNQLLDKWVIAKDLPGEVAYALDFPFYASLPRIETRLYIEQYGGDGDVWIGKTLYRMLYVNNVLYLDLAKADFNQCQAIHQLEWLGLQRWYEECGLKEHGTWQNCLLRAYFLASTSIFEPDRSAERLGWAGTAVLAEAVANSTTTDAIHSKLTGEVLVGHILRLLDRPRPLKLPIHIFRRHLRRAWGEWLMKLEVGENQQKRCSLLQGGTALLLVRSIELCAGRTELEDEPARLEYARLVRLTISVCGRLQSCVRVDEGSKVRIESDSDIDSEMQELVKCVLEPRGPNGLNRETKQTFLAVVKSIYYLAWCPSAKLNNHITKVLFEQVE